MPKPKLVESLENRCLRSVTSLLANSPNVEQNRTSSNTVGASKRCDQLPFYFLERVIEALRTNGWLNIKHLNLMITEETKRLDLSSISGIRDVKTADFIIELAATRCQELTHLVLRKVFRCSQKCFYKFLPLFRNLQVLDVSSTTFNDTCMHILGVYFRGLKELNISNCGVTDNGIEGLCGGPVDLMALGLGGQCKSIEKLTIDRTEVTSKGVQMALRQLPHLKIFERCFVTEALAEMHRNFSTRLNYALTRLDFVEIFEDAQSRCDYKKGDLRLAASVCPYITRLDIDVQLKVTDSDLRSLISLEQLSILQLTSISGTGNCRVSFDGGLAPLLKARGRSLRTLALEDVPISVQLDLLAEYCPNLERLALECNYSDGLEEDEQDSRPSKRTRTEFVWSHLEELKVREASDCDPPPMNKILSLCPPSLKRLVVSICPGLDDDFLREVMNTFKNLEQLEIHYDEDVTIDGINFLLNEENSLKKLNMYSNVYGCRCEEVSEEDLVYWRTEAKKKNWDLEILNEEDEIWFDKVVHFR